MKLPKSRDSGAGSSLHFVRMALLAEAPPEAIDDPYAWLSQVATAYSLDLEDRVLLEARETTSHTRPCGFVC